MDTTSEDLFEKLRSRNSDITLATESGEVVLQPKDAAFFEFDYNDLGYVVVSLVDEGSMKVYFDNSIVEDESADVRDDWYGFLKELSRFAHRNMLNFETHNVDKERLDKKDFEYLRNRYNTSEEDVMEGKLYGSKQKSYQDLNGAKLIVQHHRTVDEEKMGSRSRNIKAIYIENGEGERFKFTNNYLPGARAMARHVSNSGYPNDPAGSHIVEIMREMQDLKHFVRKVKTNEYVDDDAQEVIECATDRYYGLKNTLVGMTKQKGYVDYFENWEPNEIEVDENDLNDLRAKLTRSEFDDRLTDSLSAVGRAMKLREKKSGGVYDFGKWERMAKSAGAEVKGDVKSAVAYKDGVEIGSWSQDEEDLDAKYGSDVKDPGYGEINLDQGDRGEGPAREFEVPGSLELSDGEPSWKGMQFTDNNGLLAAVLRDIAERAKDDDVAVFASDMATKVSSEGSTFGSDTKRDPEYKANKSKAVALAKMAIQAAKNESVEETSEDESMEAVDPMASYEKSMSSLIGEEEISEDVDLSDEAHELVLFGENDYDLYRQRTVPIQKNLTKKFAKGVYDPELAQKLWMYWATDAAKRYANEHSTGDDWNRIFSVAVRKEAAQYMADNWEEELEAGNKMESASPVSEDSNYKIIMGFIDQWTEAGQPDDYMDDLVAYVKKTIPNSKDWNYAASLIKNGVESYQNREYGTSSLMGLKAGNAMEEGRMSDVHLEITQMIDDGESDEDIMAAFPGLVSKQQLKSMRAEMDESVVESTADESLDWLKKAAGIGSTARSNFGIREGEQGYQMKLRDEIGKYLESIK